MANRLHANGPAVRNRLLAHLPADDFERVRAHLEHVPLARRQRLMEPDAPVEYVYFLESGMVSLILTLENGALTEVGLIGNEGLVGVLPALGASRATAEALVQIAGSALRMRADVLRKEVGLNRSLRSELLNYVQALFAQVTQAVACNSHHTLSQRLARWLLMANDCSQTNEIPLSQDFLAMMLAVQRPTVTIAIGELRKAGLIATGHGRIVILDRKGLEAAACECYGAVKDQYQRLLG